MTFRDRTSHVSCSARHQALDPPERSGRSRGCPRGPAKSTTGRSRISNLGVLVDRHAAVKERLDELREFEPSADDPSVWTPRAAGLLELNFVGMDPAQDPAEAYVLEDDRLPLLVFGALSLVSRGAEIEIGGTRVSPCRAPPACCSRSSITDRTGEKGERDLLVALGRARHVDRRRPRRARAPVPAAAARAASRGPVQPDDPLPARARGPACRTRGRAVGVTGEPCRRPTQGPSSPGFAEERRAVFG